MKLKFILKLGAISSLAVPLVTAVSANEENNANNSTNSGENTNNNTTNATNENNNVATNSGTTDNSGTNNNTNNNTNTNNSETNNSQGENNTQPPTDFNKVKELQKTNVEGRLPQIIDSIIEKITQESKEIERINQTEPSVENLSRLAYEKNVINYLKNNKDQIVADPANKLNVIFPYILSNTEYKNANITYDEENYTPVIVRDESPYNYSKVPDTDVSGNVQVDNETGTVKNTYDEKTILNTTNSYLDSLSSEWQDIFLNKDDFPKYNKDEKVFNVKDNGDLELVLPQGYNSWNDYIAEKISKRSLKFDLKQNQEFNANQKDPVVIPPVTEVEPTEEDPGIQLNVRSENIPRLSPIISADYLTYNNQGIINLFNSNQETFNKSIVFFSNPILTVIDYKVVSLKEENGKLIATVHIVNKLNNDSATYEKEVIRYKDWNYVMSIRIVNEAIAHAMSLYYNALGLDSNLNLNKLGNPKLSQAVFNQIFTAIQTINSNDFVTITKHFINMLKNQTVGVSNNNSNNPLVTVENKVLSDMIKDTFTLSIHNQTISRYTYFKYLSATYKNLYSAFTKKVTSDNKEIVDKNFKSFGFNIDKVNDAVNQLLYLILGLDKIDQSDNFNFTHFSEYTNQLAKVQKQFLNLAILTQDKEIDKNTEAEAKPFREAYQSLILSAQSDVETTNNAILIAMGSILGVILVASIALGALSIMKKKKN
ncbi:MSC_0620 family F1-like ATPase-associated subunit [Mycoplasmopsis meleagridis]|uniref:MSC_0620 family F1-like ATPase-associated subunit n=1 Tax=Mycoplasmopsis meleagridis TaxID=29561 RepID=UPI003A8C68F6